MSDDFVVEVNEKQIRGAMEHYNITYERAQRFVVQTAMLQEMYLELNERSSALDISSAEEISLSGLGMPEVDPLAVMVMAESFVEQWMEDNDLTLENSAKTEMTATLCVVSTTVARMVRDVVTGVRL